MTSQSCNAAFAVDTYSYTLRWPVRDCLRRLADLGFREFELQMYPGHIWPAHIDKPARRELKDFLAANGLAVTTLNMPNIDLNIAAATDDMREMSLRIRAALGRVLSAGIVRTRDLGGQASTTEFTEAICREIEK